MRLGKLLARGYAEENGSSLLEEAPATPVARPRPTQAAAGTAAATAAEETAAPTRPVPVTTES